MASGSSPFNAVMGEDLLQSIREWDNFAQRTYVRNSHRTQDQFLEATITEQWQVRNKFITDNPSKAFYAKPVTDKFTIDMWILRLLSPSANYTNLDALERDYKNLDESAKSKAAEARDKLAQASSKLENILSLLQELSNKEIALTDTRFTAKTRYTNQRARTDFKHSQDNIDLPTIIDKLKELKLNLGQDLSAIDEAISKSIEQYVDRISKNTSVGIILSSDVSVKDFMDSLGDFNEAVAETQDNYLNKERNQKKNEIEQLKCAYDARDFCVKHIPDIVFQSDTSYAAQLQDFVKLN